MSGAVPQRLLVTAKAIFESLKEQHINGILFGGAAVNFHGGRRETKDLDINVSSLDFKDTLPTRFKVNYDNKRPTRMKVSYDFKSMDAVKCDFATERSYLFANDFLNKYSKLSPEGVRYATVDILLADKIRTYSRRGAQQDGKRHSDLVDITHLVGLMMDNKEIMPKEIKNIFLTSENMEMFWKSLPDGDVEIYREFFPDIGIPVPEAASTEVAQ